MTLLSGLVLD